MGHNYNNMMTETQIVTMSPELSVPKIVWLENLISNLQVDSN